MANEYDDIEWETLYKKLWVYARSLKRTWGVDDTFDSGLSEEDIVSETLVLFWESKNRLGWKPNRGATLGTYMCTVLRNKFIDHLRRTNKVGGSTDDENVARTLSEKGPDPSTNAKYKSLVKALLDLVGEDVDMQELIIATELTDGGHNINQQYADLMQKTPQDIVNIKRRLLNVKGIKELLWAMKRKA